MQLTIITTPVQDAAMADLNAAGYPPNPSLSDYTISVILGKLDDLVASNQASKLDTRAQLLKQNVNKLTAQDFATIQTVIDKYAGK